MPAFTTVTRNVRLPNRERLALYARAPELGPRILFFTGGTALKALSRKLIEYTHNSIHVITPFDSGGSSAVIRKAFQMLAVGDIRNRIMALADKSVRGNPDIFELFAHRLPKDGRPDALEETMASFVSGSHALIRRVPNPMRQIIRSQLRLFARHMPAGFDLRNGCIGNLILTGGFLGFDRHIDPVVYMVSRLVEARGDVCAVSNKDLHLVSELEDGTRLIGQHLITGKEHPPLRSPIRRIYLSKGPNDPSPVETAIPNKVKERILNAELICYPMGSFYSSVVANLLPQGVAEAIRAVERPKIYIPNLGHDPEQHGMDLFQCVTTLLRYLQAGCREPAEPAALLSHVLVDTRNGAYVGPSGLERIATLGISVIDAELVSQESRPYIDAQKLVEVLLSLA
ncbi:MAG: GAK system CofD-like protein [Syntrophobacteraceae bacterium]